MGSVLLQFTLMGVNLYVAKKQQESGRNPAPSYFVAGMTFGLGLYKLLTLIL